VATGDPRLGGAVIEVDAVTGKATGIRRLMLDELAVAALETSGSAGDKVGSAGDQKTAIAPMLSVRNGVRAIEFYKRAFGAGELFRIDDASGAVVARLSVGGAEFWVADESPEHRNFSPESLGGSSVRIVMIVQDPDAAFERAITAGATIVWPVIDQYGWRLGRILDPFGHHWEIGKPL
jgi:PhnB protein